MLRLLGEVSAMTRRAERRRARALQRRQDELDYWREVRAGERPHGNMTEAEVDMKIHRALMDLRSLSERI